MTSLAARETLDKLREAKYFLRKMEETESRDTFRYNLSAFLAAARSVKDVLKREVADEFRLRGNGPAIRAAMDHIEGAMKADSEMAAFIDLRHASQHQRSLQLVDAKQQEISFFPVARDQSLNDFLRRRLMREAEQRRSPWWRATLTVHSPGQPPPRQYAMRWFFTDIRDGRDALTVCAQHFDKIQAVADDCFARFADQTS
jgi:hypothetical protein